MHFTDVLDAQTHGRISPQPHWNVLRFYACHHYLFVTHNRAKSYWSYKLPNLTGSYRRVEDDNGTESKYLNN